MSNSTIVSKTALIMHSTTKNVKTFVTDLDSENLQSYKNFTENGHNGGRVTSFMINENYPTIG